MDQDNLPVIVEEARAYVAQFTVGFLKLSVREIDCGNFTERVEEGEPAGSGALVTVGDVSGILTAAHVLRNLPDRRPVGIVDFPPTQRRARRQTIDMGLTERHMIGGESNKADGPDLGFLKLLPTDAAALKASNSVFFNLEKRRASILARERRGRRCFDGISGVVAERTTDLPPEDQFGRVLGVNALYGVALVRREHEAHGFDLIDLEVTYDGNAEPPDSFEGMSGGALWRVFLEEDERGGWRATERIIYGVAFHQSGVIGGRRTVTCHGPQSVYGTLIDAVRERWPG